jgi:hypothetical protein
MQCIVFANRCLVRKLAVADRSVARSLLDPGSCSPSLSGSRIIPYIVNLSLFSLRAGASDLGKIRQHAVKYRTRNKSRRPGSSV